MKFFKMLFMALILLGALGIESYAEELNGDLGRVQIKEKDSKKYVCVHNFASNGKHIYYELTGSPQSDYWFSILMNNLANYQTTELTIKYEETPGNPYLLDIDGQVHFIIQLLIIYRTGT